MATISPDFAVMESFGMRMSGLPAKLAWVFVHIEFLVLGSNRIQDCVPVVQGGPD